MNIMISGGTGLLGTALTKSFLADGHKVFILSRTDTKRSDVQIIKWDARTTEGWGHLVNEMNVIIHLAGRSTSAWPWSAANKKSFEDSRILPGLALAQAIQEATRRPSLFLQVSGINHYGLQGGLADETTPPGEDFLAQLTVKWESATQSVEGLGVRRLVFRTPPVLSRDNVIMKLIALPVQLFVGGPIGAGKQPFPWIHIKDWVSAVRYLMANESASGVYNMIAPSQTSLADFTRVLANVLHRPYWFPVPAFLMRNVLGEMSVLILEGRFAQPKRLLESGYTFQFPGPREALTDLYG
ncbi:MAG: TIGR01777 family oxidoreductase [Anaerolineales bacterium]